MSSEFISLLVIPCLATIMAFVCERFGPRCGGLIAALPLVSGATLAVIAANSDAATVRVVVFHALMGSFAATALLRAYGYFCARYPLSACLLLALIAFVCVGVATSPLSTELLSLDAHSYSWVIAVWAIAIASVVFALPKKCKHNESTDIDTKKKLTMKTRLAIRVGAGTLFGYAAIYVNAQFGPVFAGVLLALPPVTLPHMLIEHRLAGGHSARKFIDGRNRHHVVQVAFLTVLCVAASEMSIAAAFTLAFAISACILAALWLMRPYLATRSVRA